MNIVLASASPRRASLLAQLGLSFKTVAPDVDERIHDHEAPDKYVQRVAVDKAAIVSQQYPDYVVIAADTVAILHNQVLGKANDRESARQMLQALKGQKHQVYTAVAMNYKDQSFRQLATTTVTMANYDDSLLEAYLDSGDWQDKAGACSLQGRGGLLIESIEGDLHTVVGLSLASIYQGLQEFGFSNDFYAKFAQPVIQEMNDVA